MKKIPMRMDALSRKRYLRSELARFVKRDGFLVFDPEGTMSGRGTYLHLDEESLNDWIKVEIQGLIAEAYKKNVPKVLNWVGKNVKLKSKQGQY